MRRIVVGTVVLAVVGTVAWLGVRSSAGEAESFRLVSVGHGSVEKTITTTGTLEPMVTVQVGTQVSGQISEILVDFNDRVAAGEVIARIDPSDQEMAVSQAKIAVRKAAADLADRKREAARIEGLHDRNLAAEIDYASAQYQLELAEAASEAARIDLERAEQNLEYATIRAPISGVVVERSVDVGQTVAASLSAPELFLLAADLAEMRILASVDESDVGQIAEGQKARFTVQAYPEEEFEGVVRQIRLQSSLQDNVVSYTVVVDVANEDHPLLPGMTATVDFLVETAEDVLTIPNSALRFTPSEELMAEAVRNTRTDRDGGSGGPSGAGDPRLAGVGPSATPTSSDDPGADGSALDAPARGDSENGGASGDEGAASREAGSRGRRRGDGSGTFVLYVGDDGRPRVAPLTTGITDGQQTAIGSPVLMEGMSVIAGTTTAASGGSSTSSQSPFNQQSETRRSGPPRPGGF